MTQNPGTEFDGSDDSDKQLLDSFRKLWAEADELWEQHQDLPAFAGYVSADYRVVFDSLAELRGRVFNVLEWGSGLGVVTIMASRMGFEACGIESELSLVEYSEDFASQYGPEARFAQGSFIPDDFEWKPAEGEDVNRTMIDIAAGYDTLDMQLRDFDLIYAYPWPEEHTLFRNIIREFGHREAMLLSYDAREGINLVRVGEGHSAF